MVYPGCMAPSGLPAVHRHTPHSQREYWTTRGLLLHRGVSQSSGRLGGEHRDSGGALERAGEQSAIVLRSKQVLGF